MHVALALKQDFLKAVRRQSVFLKDGSAFVCFLRFILMDKYFAMFKIMSRKRYRFVKKKKNIQF